MELIGVKDIEALHKRFEECFALENHDRPLIGVTAPKSKDVKLPAGPKDIREGWFAFDWRLDLHQAITENQYFAGEAFPHYICNLGPDVFTAYLGSELEFAEHTSWAMPRVKNWEEEPPLRFNPGNKYWKEMEKYIQLSVERGRDKWITGTGDIHANGDALSALRGPENLCMDLIECPDQIHRRLQEVFAAWREVIDRTHSLIMPHSDGFVTCWLPVLVRGKYATVQNDFSCMISPSMFREFFQKPQEDEVNFLDRGVYHWDGPGAIPHLDALCEIRRLEMLQWTPGDGALPMTRWIELLRKAQDKGKCLWISCTPAEVPDLTEALKPEGVIFWTGTDSPAEADALVKKTEEICRDKRK